MVSLYTYSNSEHHSWDLELIPVFKGNGDFPLKPEESDFEKLSLFRSGTQGEKDKLYIGLGDAAELTPYRVMRAGGTAGRFAREHMYEDVCLSAELGTGAAEFCEGFMLGTYTFRNYKTGKAPNEVRLSADAALLQAECVVDVTSAIEGTAFTRDLANLSTDELYPESFADILKKRFEGSKVDIRVYKHDELISQGFVGTEAVGRGGAHNPCYMELRYCTDDYLPLTALIGKGMTFNMGGVNAKHGHDLSSIRTDMGGAAAVAGAMDIIRASGAEANVVALIPLAENLSDAKALLPGMVLRYPGSITVEIKNTDTVGRLVLADALLHAGRLGAVRTIDIATLTGNIGAAIGDRMAGIFSNSDRLCNELIRCGEETGDRLWRMPLIDDYIEHAASDLADIANISSEGYAGALSTAIFLKSFVRKDTVWAHIDISGVSFVNSPYGFLPRGASGFGARMLANFTGGK